LQKTPNKILIYEATVPDHKLVRIIKTTDQEAEETRGDH
jgi:hypothetical protein